MMLMSADMIIIHNSGKVLGLVLCIALLAAITLAPAMIVVMGKAFFWPGSAADHLSVGQRYVWPRLAKDLVRRPYAVFFCGLLVVSLPAVASFWTPLRYDTLGVVPEDTTAERGLAMLNAHFWEEEIFSTRLLIESSDFASGREQLKVLSDGLAARLTEVEDVSDVWHLGAPAGRRRGSGLASVLASPLVREQITEYYYDQRQHVLQMEVMQRHPPWSPEAVAVLGRLQQTTHEWARQNLESGYNLHALGQTPYIQDVKNIADGDLGKVVWLVTGVIWIIVLAVIRRVYLSIFMLVATLLSFAAAFGLTGWIFVDLWGGGGVDYKVQILLFVIIVAVGQDYNIFLVRRMLEELKSFELDEAITRSVILTGPIISSCGLIMAATLGSLATTRVALTRQMGFACAAGILIDTFLVRPLLIPSFYLILERLNSRRHGPAKENSERRVPARPE
jgi:RND superfamily putative drug exporter